MAKNQKATVTINDKEYLVDDLSDDAKVYVDHLNDFDNKLRINQFTANSLALGRQMAVNLLAQEVERASDQTKEDEVMEMDALWSIALTAGLGLMGWLLRSAYAEVQRISILLNKTREEMAREYVTKTDSSAVMSQIVARFDRIEEKIDRLMER